MHEYEILVKNIQFAALNNIIDDVEKGEAAKITRDGEPIAVIISVEEYEEYKRLLEEHGA